MSTDPAHSLGDALGVRLGPRVGRIRRGLDAVELDASRAFARWIANHRSAAADVLEHGTWLDRDDIDALLDLPLPGVDELVGLIEIDRLARAGAAGPRKRARTPYDRVIVDTAPTGHTLRLLAAPDAVRVLAEVFDAMQSEHRLIREQLARIGRPDAADRLITEIAAQAAAIAASLRDPRETQFVWVTLPEPMSLAESQDALAALDRAGIRVGEVIVNRVLTDEGPCAICDRRRSEQRGVIARIRRTIGRGRTVRIADEMSDGFGFKAHGHRRDGSSRAKSISPEPLAISHESARLIFVGGKGGVGKTTVAAAIALSVARADHARRVLLLSTDPAHSLADVFASPMSDRVASVPHAPANLFVREVDAAAAFAARKSDLDAALAEIASSVGAASAAEGDLVDLAPPGVDELFGLLSVFDARQDYDAIVVDTAPTGHALRLLELPDEARTWVQVLLRVLLKYRSLVRPGRLAAELVDVSKSIREFQAMLRDRDTTRVYAVTRAAELPRVETVRFLAQLTKLRLFVPAVVVNAVTPASGSCGRCRRTRAVERREVAALRRVVGRRSIIPTPLVAPAPRGVRALESWARTWLA